jgi:phage tail sheath gpL-like
MTIPLSTEIIQSNKTPRTAIAFDKNSGVKQRSSTAREIVIIGQMLATGTATVSTPYDVLREAEGEGLFGPGCPVDVAIKSVFKVYPTAKITAVGVADAGTKASGTVTFANNATAGTTYRFRIAGVPLSIDIATGDTPTIIAAALAAAINANTSLPVTASPAVGVVTITAKVGGTLGNTIQMRGAFDLAAGTTATLSAAQLSGGTGAVSIAAALAATATKRYHEHVICLDDSTTGGVAKTHVNTQGAAETGFGCFAHQAVVGTQSAATTHALALNGDRSTLAAINGSESWFVAIVAAFAAACAMEEVPNRPLNTVVLTGIVPPPVEKRWTPTELRVLLDNGVTPLVATAGEEVAICRAVVTGVKNTSGNFSYEDLDIGIQRSLDAFRDNIRLMFETNYPRARWANEDPDGLLPPDVATPSKVTQDIIDVARDLESQGVLQNVEALKDQFVVEKVGTQCQFSAPADVIDGMHEKYGSIVLFRKTVTSV